ncbi:hypothetical protein [Nocardioides speluncae]|uniref:hypothetical protein n=1 Tax=Nocardioides speluncae TaxID=2670337 RepID=UPI000D699243|nr:hypothetical protein [Nocardioides speluncae]
MKRIIVGVLAAFIALFLAATLAPAQATAPAAEDAAMALEKRFVGIKASGTQIPNAHLSGHVGPRQTYKWSKVIIQRRVCASGTCKWSKVKVIKTNGVGNYHTVVNLPSGARRTYRALVPPRGNYGWSPSKALEVFWT